MRVLVISNDLVPGLGVPVAAPGLRAAGLAEGLRAHGHDVSVSVPSGVADAVTGVRAAEPPPFVQIVDPRSLMDHIVSGGFEVVVFSNANMTPHLEPRAGVHFVFDMFAPKLLESLASEHPTRPWQEQALEKERGLALADEVWVNGTRKLGYALGWLVRPAVDAIRQSGFGKPSTADAALLDRVHVVEMPVPLPAGIDATTHTGRGEQRSGEPIRVGVAGYVQQWSALSSVHHAHQLLIDSGHELHAMLPHHWGGAGEAVPTSTLPEGAVIHDGPLLYDDFCRWVQSMDCMVDVFAASRERHFAMITRSAVALRLGVPILHGVDSEIADIVRAHNAGWVIDPDDAQGWATASRELSDPKTLSEKRAGALEVSRERFAPDAALRAVATALHDRST